MINRTKKYWTGEADGDIPQYLREYSEDEDIDVKSVVCHKCGKNIFELTVDADEGAVKVKCTKCKTEKILLDGEEVWEECNPEAIKCPACKTGKKYNVKVGFIRRKNGDAKWVYIGNRCCRCGALGSVADWGINYSPTDEMEKNI